MTERLYEEQSYAVTFDASVANAEYDGDKTKVVLTRTLFFPEEGGQSADRGTLNGLPVLDVQLQNGEPVHTVAGLLNPGDGVKGSLDWDFRFRNMQMHSGEHVFSGLVHTLFGYRNVGFHLSENSATMDYSGKLTEDDIHMLERRANAVIAENHAIRAWYPTAEELSKLDYRSKKELDGPIRLVEIEGVDLCACCVPHVRSTAEIGCLKITAFENYKGGVRLHYLCGLRAMEHYYDCLTSLTEVGRMLSVKPEAVCEAVDKLKKEAKELTFRVTAAERRGTAMELKLRYLSDGGTNEGAMLEKAPLVFLKGDAGILRYAMDELRKYYSGTCAIFCGEDGQGYRYLLECAGGGIGALQSVLRTELAARGGGSDISGSGSVQASMEQIRTIMNRYGID